MWETTFISLITAFARSMLILLLSGNSVLIYFFRWEILGLTSFLLVIYYKRNHVWKTSYIIIIINLFSDAIFVYILVTHSNRLILIVCISIVSITKSAIFPFHVWLPWAIDAPTPVSCLLHSSTLVLRGVLFYKTWNSITINYILIILSVITILLARNNILNEFDIKKWVANSTILNIGIVIYFFRSNIINQGILHIYRHSLYKRTLFLVCGYILIVNYSNQDIRNLTTSSYIILLIVPIFRLFGIFFVFTSNREHILMNPWNNWSILFLISVLLVTSNLLLCIINIIQIIIPLTTYSINQVDTHYYRLAIILVPITVGYIYFNGDIISTAQTPRLISVLLLMFLIFSVKIKIRQITTHINVIKLKLSGIIKLFWE